MIDLSFRIPIDPVAKGRPKTRIIERKEGRPIASHYTPPKTAKYERAFARLAEPYFRQVKTLEEPLRVDLLFVVRRPKAMRRGRDPEGWIPHAKRPDRDNLTKAVLDALKAHWADDALVFHGTTTKVYGGKGEEPHVRVRIRSVDSGFMDRVRGFWRGCDPE